MRARTVAVVSLLFTYLFFIEYLPPLQQVHIPYDLEGFHYPLDDYAFLSFRQHRFPEWDPTMYCGMSFVGNPQTALFYPPMWLVFAANRHQPWLRYVTLEMLELGHVWLAFLFCFLWLRNKRLTDLACILGAGVYAYSGYLLHQLQHLGLVGAYTWFPFGLWGIDQAAAAKSWRPLWKVAVASAMAFLVGYPPLWFAFAVFMMVYSFFAPWRWKAALGAGFALVFSLLIVMVQLAPSWELSQAASVAPKYSGNMHELRFWIPYLIANYFDFALTTPVLTNPGGEYRYLGAPALFGLFALVRYGRLKTQIPILAVAAATLILVTDPFELVSSVIKHSALLMQVCRAYYFLGGLTLAIAALAAAGLDAFLRRDAKPLPRWVAPVTIVALAAWAVREVWLWLPGEPRFAAGWNGAWDLAAILLLFSLGIFALRAAKGAVRPALLAILLLSLGIDYKVFGTSKRVNAATGNPDKVRRSGLFLGMSDAAYQELQNNATYRVVADLTGPHPEALRHRALATPQGRDPLASAQIRKVVGELDSSGFRLIDPAEHDLLRSLGVRYFITSEGRDFHRKLIADPEYRAVGPPEHFYKVFELVNPQLPYHWERAETEGGIQRLAWIAERREFQVHSSAGGRFVLVEQNFPGWTATIDNRPTPIATWNSAFQSIDVPPGDHRIRFAFRSRTLRPGAIVSVIALAALALLTFSQPKLWGRPSACSEL